MRRMRRNTLFLSTVTFECHYIQPARSEEACMHIGSLVHVMPHSHAFATNMHTLIHAYIHERAAPTHRHGENCHQPDSD